MQGNPAVVAALVSAASLEMSLAVQYHLDSHDLENQELEKLAKKICGFGEDGECYAGEIVDRIYALNGTPVYMATGATQAESVTALFDRALKAETALVAAYQDWCIEAQQAKDDNTRNKFEHWIKWHEDDHIDWLEKQLAKIKSFGESKYIEIQLNRR